MDKTKLAEFWRRNQTLLLILPLTMVFLQLAWMVLQALDPRIGVEGFGDLFGYALNAVRGVVIVGLAWLTKRNLFFDLHDKTELSLYEAMKEGDWPAFWIVVLDRVEWAFLLVFYAWVMTR